MLEIIELQNEVRLNGDFEMYITCSCVFLCGRNLRSSSRGWRELFLLGMKIKMMGFSLEKMGIGIGIKRR